MGTALRVIAVLLALYAALVFGLYVAGRRTDARALAGFVPDCVILFKRLIGDPRISRRRKFWLGVLIAYLVMPFDLVPDFIPVIGYADDVVIVAVALRAVVRHAGPAALERHWRGTPDGLAAVCRVARLPRPQPQR